MLLLQVRRLMFDDVVTRYRLNRVFVVIFKTIMQISVNAYLISDILIKRVFRFYISEYIFIYIESQNELFLVENQLLPRN